MIQERSARADGELVELDLALAAPVNLGRVQTTFGGIDAPWLGEPAPDGPPGRRFACDLELQVSPERRTLFRKAAIVGLGVPRPDGDDWIVPIEWFPATLTPLFPVFVGELRLMSGRVELHGRYAPPGGAIGVFLDRVLMNVAARGTGSWFLRKVTAVLD